MAINNLNFHLKDGFVQNWLVAGPESAQVSNLASFPKDEFELSICKHFYTPESGVTEKPVDVGPLTKIGDKPGPFSWHYYRCAEDHFIDFSTTSLVCSYLRAWAYLQLELPQALETTLTLTTNGPADLWLNEKHAHRHEHFQKQLPASVSFQAELQAGSNQILVRVETTAVRETAFVLALQIAGLPEEAQIILPTEIENDYFEIRKTFEELIPLGYLEKYVYGWMDGDHYDKNEPITVRFTKDKIIDQQVAMAYRLQSLFGDIYQEGNKVSDTSIVYELAKNFPLRNGPHYLELVPEAGLYYLKKVQLQRRDLFYVVRTPYSNHLYGIIHERRHEAIEDAAKRRGNSLYTEFAKMVLGQWEKIDKRVLQQSFDRIDQREDGCVIDLLGFIGILLRLRRKPEFPKGLRTSIETRLAGFRYWEDEPGEDVMDFRTESRQLLFHACEIMAGQILTDQNFSNSNQNGRWHREKGERLTAAWITQRGAYGWQEWDSPNGFEEELAALSYLVDFASSSTISELASIMMDKTFFALAIHSFQGSFGSTHGRSDTAGLISSRLEATSGITRIMWGMGNFNEHIVGTVSLAQTTRYDFPGVLKDIATRLPDGFWDRERHGAPQDSGSQMNPNEVNKVTYRTHDYMLSSSQAYGSFTPGVNQHIWQATLGPDAVVFVNHPVCISENDARQPNFWNGNGNLPRVIQWGDVLVAQYRLPDEDWLGFTHAYFPTSTFDQVTVESQWAFARKGKGYLALFAFRGFELITHGQSALRELRSFGKENIWVCQMGQELLDGSFESFTQKCKEMNLAVEGLSINLHSLRGDEIAISPENHMTVNGQEQIISAYRHYESPYCIAEYPAEKLEIGLGEQGIRLDFSESKEE
jgi:hypothetical protein